MARSFAAFEAKGLKTLLRRVKKSGEDIVKEIDAEMAASGETIARAAKRAVPKDTGFLANAISSAKKATMSYEIVAQRHYGPYVEFGTGGLVNVPAGLENYAIQFKGNGIKQVNLPPRPFLFPAYEEERKKLIDRIKKNLSK